MATDQAVKLEHDNGDDQGHLPLSVDEQAVLAFYDRLQELRLEVAIINAQSSMSPDMMDEEISEDEMRKAQEDLLEARARYRLRHDVLETVMMANPILKAVHGNTEASPVERDILPYVERRDQVAISVANQATRAFDVRKEMTKVQAETLRVARQNVDLTTKVFELADEVKRRRTEPLDDPRIDAEVKRLEGDLSASRTRWRVIKGVASGIVAGSGVDWARDEALRDIVLDPETEY